MIQRKILSQIKDYYFTKEVVLLIGSRRVGKSSILKIIEKDLLVDDYGVFLDADFNSELVLVDSSKKLLDILELNGYLKDSSKKFIVFLDEFQKIKDIGTSIKGIYDNFSNIKFFLSGSSSILINKVFGDSMMGRKIIFNVERLDFEEFLHFKSEKKLEKIYKNLKLGQDYSLYKSDFDKKISEFLIFGGYPEIVLGDSKEYKIKKLEEILNSYLQRDIKDFFLIEHSENILKLLKYLISINSKLLKISSISKDIGISVYNLEKYISVLRETFFIKILEPFYNNKIKSISKAKKVFFSDIGVYNFLSKNFNEVSIRADRGSLVESFAYSELYKNKDILDEIYFYRDKNSLEVDFLLLKNSQKIPIEVKSGTYEQIPSNLINFSTKNNLNLAILFNRDVFKIEEKKGLKIIFLPYFLVSRISDFI